MAYCRKSWKSQVSPKVINGSFQQETGRDGEVYVTIVKDSLHLACAGRDGSGRRCSSVLGRNSSSSVPFDDMGPKSRMGYSCTIREKIRETLTR